MNNLGKIALGLLLLSLAAGLSWLLAVQKSKISPVQNALCPALDSILSSVDKDFMSIKGDFHHIDGADTEYKSKIHILKSVRNVLHYSPEEVPLFITSLYQGIDSMEAYNRYLLCNQQLMECLPYFRLGDKANYEKFPGALYVIFYHQDKLIYLIFAYDSTDGKYSTVLTVTSDPETPDWDKIHGYAPEMPPPKKGVLTDSQSN